MFELLNYHHLCTFRAAAEADTIGEQQLKQAERAKLLIGMSIMTVVLVQLESGPMETGSLETGTMETGSLETGPMETGSLESSTRYMQVAACAESAWNDKNIREHHSHQGLAQSRNQELSLNTEPSS